MSLRDLCDTAYVLQVERLERRAVSSAAALAGQGVDSSGLADEIRAEFDTYLGGTSRDGEPEGPMQSMLRDLGVA